MKKALSILILASLSTITLAAGEHDMKSHQMQNHNMDAMHKDTDTSMVGKPGDSAKVVRTIDVTMDDNMRFTPSQISIVKGETVRFFIKNTGKIPHEMVIGTLSELKEHAEMMRNMPDMKHVGSNAVTLAPGQRGGLVWHFDKTGIVDFACLIPGHLEAGMAGKIEIQ